MGVTQPHPDGDLDLPVTHVYRHPEGAGLGAHHADPGHPPLQERPAHPGSPPDWPRSSLTMHDLDLGDGTELHHLATDAETGWLLFAWNDKQGDARITSLSPDQAAEFLEPPQDEPGPDDETGPAEPEDDTEHVEGQGMLWRSPPGRS